MSTVLTLGTFDLFHFGHMRFFKKCKQFGDVKVGLNSDEFIIKYKSKPPILSYEERLLSLIEYGFYVDEIMINRQEDGTIKDVVEHFNPDRIVIGSDWLKKDYLPQIGLDADYLTNNGISLIYVPYETLISNTMIQNRLHAK